MKITVPARSFTIPAQEVEFDVPADATLTARVGELETGLAAVLAELQTPPAPPAPVPPAPVPPAPTPPAPVPTIIPIAEADIFAKIDNLLPFASAKGGAALESAGTNAGSIVSLNDVTGYFNATSPAGMRFGKVNDPLDPTKKCFLFAPSINDSTAGGGGSKRTEVSWWVTQSGAIKPYIDIWHAFGLLMPDGGYDFAAVISQYHQTTTKTVNPWAALQAEKDRLMLFVRFNTNNPPTQATNQTRPFASPGIPKDKWTVFVTKMRIDPRAAGLGYFKCWRDGVLFADYKGPTGYATIEENPTWQKFGFYPWDLSNWKTPATVKVLFKAPVYAKDTTGKYSEADFRSYVLAR